MIVYRTAQLLARGLAGLILPELVIRGRQNIPSDGAFLLAANHQSILDPILIQSVVRRPLHTMAKSTQFAAPGMGWLLNKLKAFPVRRYQIDPQCVRVALRRLGQGEGVGVYVEGERSWDGRLQPPRLGTVRLILKAGAPVVPCAITGAYDVWPRWDRRIRREPVRITFGSPLRFPRLDRREDRERELDAAGERVMNAIRRLMRQR